jgi:hypothetical protein
MNPSGRQFTTAVDASPSGYAGASDGCIRTFRQESVPVTCTQSPSFSGPTWTGAGSGLGVGSGVNTGSGTVKSGVGSGVDSGEGDGEAAGEVEGVGDESFSAEREALPRQIAATAKITAIRARSNASRVITNHH